MLPIPTTRYAELYCQSNFSFLTGASSAMELFERAKTLGYEALAISDEATLAGIVRALEASEATGLKLLVGGLLTLECGLRMVLLARDLAGYQQLCAVLTRARRNAEKGAYSLSRLELTELLAYRPSPHVLGLLVTDQMDPKKLSADSPVKADLLQQLLFLQGHFSELRLGISLWRDGLDPERLAWLMAISVEAGVRPVACGGVQMHQRARRPLHDVMSAIRLGCTVSQAGYSLTGNGERHLRKLSELQTLYPPELLRETVHCAELCQFSLRQIRYEYPRELVPKGFSASQWLRQLTEQAIKKRWPPKQLADGTPQSNVSAKVRAQIEHELALIAELGYESYFLTVADIVQFARGQNILCQGRGSAANSAVCFCLGITEVDPARMAMLFERFISKERNEPPDIDVDFEHQRREEVFQYIYRKYGRNRAALAATVICYRPKSALRDVAKALGLSRDQQDALAGALSGWSSGFRDKTTEAAPNDEPEIDGDAPYQTLHSRLRERGLDPHNPKLRKVLLLAEQLLGSPRHLSQHVGGFVISEHDLSTLVPVENAAMADRTVLQWDKDDLDTLGLLKVDCLALGMLSCIQRCLQALGMPDLSAIPAEDPATYEMIQKADTLGVFQIESRAQMAMLPRLKPANFYDLVIEVAIVRPGPIQGKMVHPYLQRRQGLEPVHYPSADLKAVFERTLGVPIFQEQVMQLAIVAAGFTPGEADQLRRSMAAWKRRGGLEHMRQRILSGMAARGYELSFAEQVFEQIKGFGSYGFPESHAASFALLVYASCYLKCHYPVHFACALLNSQPMGFYQPAQIVSDLKRHGYDVLPVDIQHSHWQHRVEKHEQTRAALRLGFAQVKGLRQDSIERLLEMREDSGFRDFEQLRAAALACGLEQGTLKRLADADALKSLSGNRNQARWASTAPLTDFELPGLRVAREATVSLAEASPQAELFADYASTGLSLTRHPLALLRSTLTAQRYITAQSLPQRRSGSITRCAGLVTLRQRPGTAGGVTFLTLEDETGLFNVVVWPAIYEKQRRVLLDSAMLGVLGNVESAQGVTHLIAQRLLCLDHELRGLAFDSRDFY